MNRPKIIFYVIVAVLITLIIFRYYQVESGIESNELRGYIDKEAVLTGKVAAEPDVRETNIKLTIESARDPISGR